MVGQFNHSFTHTNEPVNLKVGDSWGDHGFGGTCLSRFLWLGNAIAPNI